MAKALERSRRHSVDPGQLTYVKISDVKIGERFRKDASRNIGGLMQSIEAIGLLQYPLVDMDLNLICGERRITALKNLGHDMVQVIRREVPDPLLAQMAENEHREGWTPEERMACVMRMAKEENTGRRGRGNWTDRVGKAVGLSGHTVHKAYQVMKAGEDDPKRYGDLAQRLRRTGRVDGIYQEYKSNQREIRGIRTNYKGITFRSLTEARWAALFDARGSGIDSWKYEPYELNGWIPDFELKIGTSKVLVETKAETSLELLFLELEKIDRSGAHLPVWKMGAGLFAEWPDGTGRVAGITRDFARETENLCWRPFVRPHKWLDLWKKACLMTQWHPNRNRQDEPARDA